MKKETILMKNGLDKNGQQLYNEVKVYKHMPKGWKETEGTMTDPSGYKWIDNNKPLFTKDKNGKRIHNKNRQSALLERDWHNKMSSKGKDKWHTGHPLTIIDSRGNKTTYGKTGINKKF